MQGIVDRVMTYELAAVVILLPYGVSDISDSLKPLAAASGMRPGGNPPGEQRNRVSWEGSEGRGGSGVFHCRRRGVWQIKKSVGQGGGLARDSHKLSYTGRSDGGLGGRGWQLCFSGVRRFHGTQRKGGSSKRGSGSARPIRPIVITPPRESYWHARFYTCWHGRIKSDTIPCV